MLVKMRQVQKISREDLSTREEPSETTRQAPQWTTRQRIALAYLNGALGDASRNKKSRIRYAQKYPKWLETLQQLLAEVGSASWIYKEGKHRQVFILETCCPYLDFACNGEDLESREEKIAYIQGFFDAEGGVPHKDDARFYIQLVQKDKPKIEMFVRMLTTLSINTGVIHNPSVRVDPEYWRVFISTRSHRAFAQIIGSCHPVKGLILHKRMKI